MCRFPKTTNTMKPLNPCHPDLKRSTLFPLAALLAGCLIVPLATCPAQSPSPKAHYSVVGRGMDFRTWPKSTTITDPAPGVVTPATATSQKLGNEIFSHPDGP